MSELPTSEFVRLYRLIADLFELAGVPVHDAYDHEIRNQVQGLALERYIDQQIGVADDEAVWVQSLKDQIRKATA